MHEVKFLNSIRRFEKSDAIDRLGKLILTELAKMGHQLVIAQCTIIDMKSNNLRMWIFCNDGVTSSEQLASAMKRPRSTALYTISTLQHRFILDTDGDEKMSYLFLFLFLLNAQHIDRATFLKEIRSRGIAH